MNLESYITPQRLEVLDEISQSGRIEEGDLLKIRAAIFIDGHVSRAEAEAVFALNEAVDTYCVGWAELFIEAIVDHIVHQADADGFVSNEDAIWLSDRIAKDGKVETETELELFIKVLESAVRVPEQLEFFVLNEVKRQILEGDGPLRSGLSLQPKIVGEAEVEVIRRVIYAAAGANNIGVSKGEAEVLFDINDATIEAENHAAWSDLFVKAIANHLITSFGYQAVSRDEALRRDQWLGDTSFDLGRALSSALSGVLAKRPETEVDLMVKREAEITNAERIDHSEAAWLVERIGRDGVLHENERAMLEFIRDEASHIHDDLTPLLRKLA